MRDFEYYKNLVSLITKHNTQEYQVLYDLYEVISSMRNDFDFQTNIEVRKWAMKYAKYIHEMCQYQAAMTGSIDWDDFYWKTILLEARCMQVDSGLLYLEKNRRPEDRFYLPRRKIFTEFGIVDGLQKLIDDELDYMSVSLVPGSGKSTIEIFFLALVGGWYPNDFNLSSAHSSILTRSLYDGVVEILNDPYEYTWHEIFPSRKLQATNAKETTVNLDKAGRFKTWTFRSIDGSLTGATRCNRFLTADDLVSGIEEALNKTRMETLWTKVVNDLRSRRLEGCKEIFFATRWSVHDPLGKMEDLYRDNPRALIIAVPALNEYGKSNFEYDYGVGFSTEYFMNQRAVMDDLSWDALYMQKPIEREGLLFPPGEFRRFFIDESQIPENHGSSIVMPKTEPDAIWAVCDTKDKGSDYESMPVAYQFGEDFYIVDVVFDDTTDYDVLDHKTADTLIKHNPHNARFESNNAGGRVADNVQKLINGKCRTMIETKFTNSNKATKILVNSHFIKKHFLFLESALYAPKSDYGKFMANVSEYTTKKEPPHDDGPDSLAMLAEYVTGRGGSSFEVIRNPLWG